MHKNNNGQANVGENASRRADLLCAAARLMREKGYAGTTTRELAKAVGMSAGSPFCHFRSKREILAELVSRGMGDALARAENLAARHPPGPDLLRELIHLHTAILHGPDGDFSVVMFREWRLLAPECRRRLVEMMSRYETIWRACLRDTPHLNGVAFDIDVATRLILGSLNWSQHWLSRDRRMDARQLADAVVALFRVAPARNAADVSV